MEGSESSNSAEQSVSQSIISRRNALKGGATIAGAAAVGGLGMLYLSQPVVASEIDDGADDVIFDDPDENVVSVTDVTIQPDIAVEFSNYSSGVDEMELEITVQVDAEQEDGEYSGDQDTWDAPTTSSDSITVRGTVATDGSEQGMELEFDDESTLGTFQVETTDFTDQTSSDIDDPPEADFEFLDSISLQDILEQDGDIDTGIEMFPQDIDADHYGLSVVDLNYEVTLRSDAGDDNSDSSPDHEFDVVVENEGGSVDDSVVDSNTDGDGEDGV